MWNLDSLWVEVALVSIFYLIGNIFLGHFEKSNASFKKLAKYIFTLVLILAISIYVGRTYALILLSLTIVPIVYVHGIVLPRNGINGLTGEPKSKYYAFRGWDKEKI